MNIIFILVALWAPSPDQINVTHLRKFTTKTACERALATMTQGVEKGEYEQERTYDCVPHVKR